MKITELNTTDTYRLIDKDGWVSQCSHNRIMYDKWYIILLQGFTLDEVDEGDGYIGEECIIFTTCVIVRDCEYKFFEKLQYVQPEGFIKGKSGKLELDNYLYLHAMTKGETKKHWQ